MGMIRLTSQGYHSPEIPVDPYSPRDRQASRKSISPSRWIPASAGIHRPCLEPQGQASYRKADAHNIAGLNDAVLWPGNGWTFRGPQRWSRPQGAPRSPARTVRPRPVCGSNIHEATRQGVQVGPRGRAGRQAKSGSTFCYKTENAVRKGPDRTRSRHQRCVRRANEKSRSGRPSPGARPYSFPIFLMTHPGGASRNP